MGTANFAEDRIEFLKPRSKYERRKDEFGRWVADKTGDPPPVKFGAKGAYVVAEKKKFDEDARLKAGDYFDELFNAKITISGPGENAIISRTFEEMELSAPLMSNISRKKYDRPLPVQQAAFSLISQGYDLIAHAPTGSGKTGAFLIPIVDSILKLKKVNHININRSQPYCVIISPAKELAEQLYNDAREFTDGTECDVVLTFGGTKRSADLRSIGEGCDILIVTVGRLCDFVQNNCLKLHNLKFIVFDEADKLLHGNDGFADDIRNEIVPHLHPEHEVRKLFFSATDVAKLDDFARDILHCTPTTLVVGAVNSVSTFVDQHVIKVSQWEKHRQLLALLRQDYYSISEDEPKPKTIVFVNAKRRCTVIACLLSLNGFKAYPVHGGLTMMLRRRGVNAFLSGECDILVATDVLARGIDIKDVSHVINYDLPEVESWASYVHRVGRTGRLGNRGRATTFYSPESDAAMTLVLCQWLRLNEQHVPDFLEREAIEQAHMEDWHQKAVEEYERALNESTFGERSSEDDESSDPEFD
ncbi:putative ATP-dependent RNA helicase DDX4 [Toxocara canis]|uniref:RNA helicase n=1 Tax=Toxocara canis TaxID=6265 RepID=A0A0B2W0U9_TOXCA|nr:putative ATP-dependent RNA helicase DDX4 [Toxocara canis]